VIQITTNGFSRVYSDGIVGSGWVGETAARPATTTPGLSTLAFNTGEIYANPQITQIALDDVAIDLEQWIADEVDREFAIQENIAFLSRQRHQQADRRPQLRHRRRQRGDAPVRRDPGRDGCRYRR
jgi:HK97 family phage major capsid protein